MRVDPESAAGKHEHGGQTYYFCSESCLERFRASPEQFLHKPAAVAAHPQLHVIQPTFQLPVSPKLNSADGR